MTQFANRHTRSRTNRRAGPGAPSREGHAAGESRCRPVCCSGNTLPCQAVRPARTEPRDRAVALRRPQKPGFQGERPRPRQAILPLGTGVAESQTESQPLIPPLPWTPAPMMVHAAALRLPHRGGVLDEGREARGRTRAARAASPTCASSPCRGSASARRPS